MSNGGSACAKVSLEGSSHAVSVSCKPVCCLLIVLYSCLQMRLRTVEELVGEVEGDEWHNLPRWKRIPSLEAGTSICRVAMLLFAYILGSGTAAPLEAHPFPEAGMFQLGNGKDAGLGPAVFSSGCCDCYAKGSWPWGQQ